MVFSAWDGIISSGSRNIHQDKLLMNYLLLPLDEVWELKVSMKDWPDCPDKPVRPWFETLAPPPLLELEPPLLEFELSSNEEDEEEDEEGEEEDEEEDEDEEEEELDEEEDWVSRMLFSVK